MVRAHRFPFALTRPDCVLDVKKLLRQRKHKQIEARAKQKAAASARSESPAGAGVDADAADADVGDSQPAGAEASAAEGSADAGAAGAEGEAKEAEAEAAEDEEDDDGDDDEEDSNGAEDSASGSGESAAERDRDRYDKKDAMIDDSDLFDAHDARRRPFEARSAPSSQPQRPVSLHGLPSEVVESLRALEREYEEFAKQRDPARKTQRIPASLYTELVQIDAKIKTHEQHRLVYKAAAQIFGVSYPAVRNRIKAMTSKAADDKSEDELEQLLKEMADTLRRDAERRRAENGGGGGPDSSQATSGEGEEAGVTWRLVSAQMARMGELLERIAQTKNTRQRSGDPDAKEADADRERLAAFRRLRTLLPAELKVETRHISSAFKRYATRPAAKATPRPPPPPPSQSQFDEVVVIGDMGRESPVTPKAKSTPAHARGADAEAAHAAKRPRVSKPDGAEERVSPPPSPAAARGAPGAMRVRVYREGSAEPQETEVPASALPPRGSSFAALPPNAFGPEFFAEAS